MGYSSLFCFIIKGIFSFFPHKRMFYFDLVAVPMSFRGYGEYRVEKVEDTWVWHNAVTNTTMATLPPLHLNYPIGRLAWDLEVRLTRT